jgi:multidrug efflux pump subunit AcrA (membrane-fusion protein)
MSGTVSEMNPTLDPQTRTATVKLDLPTHPHLRAGQMGHASLPAGSRIQVRLPTTAVRRRGQMEYVFVVESNRAHLRLVRVGATLHEEVVIASGLEEGDVVAVEAAALTDGQAVSSERP